MTMESMLDICTQIAIMKVTPCNHHFKDLRAHENKNPEVHRGSSFQIAKQRIKMPPRIIMTPLPYVCTQTKLGALLLITVFIDVFLHIGMIDIVLQVSPLSKLKSSPQTF